MMACAGDVRCPSLIELPVCTYCTDEATLTIQMVASQLDGSQEIVMPFLSDSLTVFLVSPGKLGDPYPIYGF